ncbi:hypothetical protein L798_11671 [Zootermopsis nevadensis]|uniref:Uncharacterized protein n=1 Tax=Zootermopsis nevadensis TaxID=136037 RepID=A0A067QVD8_ZOONE|nr:hypothetical protein L798_11671 [Zootermopsis nevadensis]
MNENYTRGKLQTSLLQHVAEVDDRGSAVDRVKMMTQPNKVNPVCAWSTFMEHPPKTLLKSHQRLFFFGIGLKCTKHSRAQSPFYCHINTCDNSGRHWHYDTSPHATNSLNGVKFHFCMLITR